MFTFLISLILFFLPLQTRYIWHLGMLNGGSWEYGTFSVYSVDIFIVCFFLFVLVEKIRRKDFFNQIKYSKKDRQLFFSGVLFLSWCGLSIFWAESHFIAFFVWLRFLEVFLLVFLLRLISFNRKVVIWTFILSGVIQAFWGIMQVILGGQFASKWLGVSGLSPDVLGVSVIEYAGRLSVDGAFPVERFLRAYGGLSHPNILGGFLAMVCLYSILVYFYEERFYNRLLAFFSSGFVFIALVLTFSRGAWVAFFIGICFVLFHLIKEKTHCYCSFVLLMKTFFIIILAIFLVIPSVFFTRVGFGDSFRLEEKSITERFDGYSDFGRVFSLNPVFGTGMGNYTAVLANLDIRSSYSYQPVHNVFLLIIAEIGIVGFVFFLIFIAFLFRNNHSLFGNFYFPVMVFMVIGLFDHYTWSLPFGVLFFNFSIFFNFFSNKLDKF